MEVGSLSLQADQSYPANLGCSPLVLHERDAFLCSLSHQHWAVLLQQLHFHVQGYTFNKRQQLL